MTTPETPSPERVERKPRRGYTARGFRRIEFTEANGARCSLQKSSSATQKKVWLGCNEIGLKRLIPGQGWVDVPLGDQGVIANNRMHLTQAMVRKLLPALKRFADTGEL